MHCLKHFLALVLLYVLFVSCETKKEYFGIWEIKKPIIVGFTEMTDEEMNGYIGKKIIYAKNFVSYNGDTCYNPYYTDSVIELDDYLIGYKLSKKALGLKSDTTTITNIACESSEEWGTVGSPLIKEDSEHYLIYIRGFFYIIEPVK